MKGLRVFLAPGIPTPCRLTGVALGAINPTLRLQFEECDGAVFSGMDVLMDVIMVC